VVPILLSILTYSIRAIGTLSVIISKIYLAIRFFRIKFITNTICLINNISVQLHQHITNSVGRWLFQSILKTVSWSNNRYSREWGFQIKYIVVGLCVCLNGAKLGHCRASSYHFWSNIYIGAFEVCINYIGIGQVTKPQKCLNE